MVRRKEAGVSAVELILIVAVLTLAGALAYVYFAKTASESKADTTTQTTDKKEVAESEESPSDVVKSAFTAYRDARDKGESSDVALAAFTKYTSSELKESLTDDSSPRAVDPVLCAQNIPESLVFSAPEHGDNIVAITVSGTFSAEGAKASKSFVRVNEENKIISIECQ